MAYLCLGYPLAFEERPLLETVGWRQRLPLDQLLHFDAWDQAGSKEDSWQTFRDALPRNWDGLETE